MVTINKVTIAARLIILSCGFIMFSCIVFLTQVNDGRPPSPYKELIDIEKSRSSSAIAEEGENIPVDVGEAVRAYMESGKEPKIRARSARSGRGSETGKEEIEIDTDLTEKASVSDIEVAESVTSLSASSKTQGKDTAVNKRTKSQASNFSGKPIGTTTKDKDGGRKGEFKPEMPRTSFIKGDYNVKNVKEPTNEEREARRKMVTSLLSKQEAPKRGKLELEGIGKEGEDIESVSEGLVTRTRSVVAEKEKADLSDLAALVSRNKAPSKFKEKV